MKNIKKWSRLLIALALMCMAMGLVACGGEVTYKVTVKDALGNPYTSGMIVRFLQNGEQVALQSCDENGVAAKTLEAGEYTVEVSTSDSTKAFHYDEGVTLTKRDNEKDVIVSYAVNSEATTLVADEKEYDAYEVSTGCTYVELATDDRNYFLFTPTEAGDYEFSIVGDANAEIGYYGTPYFVQANSLVEVVDGKMSVTVKESMIGTGDTGTVIYVLGIDASDEKTTSCVLGIERVSDATKGLDDEPWTIYETTSELTEYKLPDGAEIKEFDICASTDAYNIVYNEEDGFYHLDSASGPLVLVRLAEDCDYIDCFKTILDRSDVNKYFFDEDGTFVKKERYSDCLLEYMEYVDEAEGVYPLTEDLKYIIQQRGDYVGWWDIESDGYLFKDLDGNKDTTINSEIAWLLMCCYIE